MERGADPNCCEIPQTRDWSGDLRSIVVLWGLPAAAMLIGALLPSTVRMLIWIAALLWMGMACLTNARRCGRTHCWFTGPFFLIMAAMVAGYGARLLPLGAEGWTILGAGTALGSAFIRWASERLLGRFRRVA